MSTNKELIELQKTKKFNAKFKKFLFQNPTTHFRVAIFSSSNPQFKSSYVKIAGKFPSIYVGLEYELVVDNNVHSKYKSFNLISISKPQLNKLENLVSYFSSSAFPKIGSKKAKKIIDALGLNAIEKIISNDSDFWNIDLKKSDLETIYSVVIQSEHEDELFTFFTKNNLQLSYYNWIKQLFIDNNFLDLIQDNLYKVFIDLFKLPYSPPLTFFHQLASIELCKIIEIDLKKAIILNNIEIDNFNTGSTLSTQKIIFDLFKKENASNNFEDEFHQIIIELITDHHIVEYVENNVHYLQLAKYYNAELNISQIIANLYPSFENNKKELAINTLLNKQQFLAINNSLVNSISIILGSPGTGKTTIIKEIINHLPYSINEIALLTPTGRAAKQIEILSFSSAKTIHRYLKWNRFGFDINTMKNPLIKVIILDESSMIGTLLFYLLLHATPNLKKIILIGDHNQISPIDPGNILIDLLKIDEIPIAKLTHNYRQDHGSLIPISAKYIIENKYPKFNNIDCVLFNINEQNIQNLIIDFSNKIVQDPKLIYQFQILAPIYEGVNGINNLNQRMQNALQISKNKLVYKSGDISFYVGDKVMQIENNYDLQIYNGEIGIINQLTINKEIEVDFGDKKILYSTSNFYSNLQLAYAISIHKAQGSEFDNVALVMPNHSLYMLNKNLLYTAWTRAKKILLVYSNKEFLEAAITKKSPTRHTLLPTWYAHEIAS